MQRMKRDRGVALILALLVLSFLTVLGGALLTTATIDVWISDNYKTATQTLYLAEAGIDDARQLLRISVSSPTQLLSIAAGPDGQLLTDDDVPLIASRQLVDASGQSSGYYEVWLRNDSGDGIASVTDSNDVLTLISIGRLGRNQKSIEVTVEKGKFPESDTDARLQTVSGLEQLANSIRNNAIDVYTAPTAGDLGGPADYRVVAVDGNLDLQGGTGYGILLVRGELNVTGNITWHGLMIVIGQGVLRWAPGVSRMINGGVFVAQTRAADGSTLAVPAGVEFTITDVNQIRKANQSFPYSPIAIRER